MHPKESKNPASVRARGCRKAVKCTAGYLGAQPEQEHHACPYRGVAASGHQAVADDEEPGCEGGDKEALPEPPQDLVERQPEQCDMEGGDREDMEDSAVLEKLPGLRVKT